jgi:anti-sigma B factor antagonist
MVLNFSIDVIEKKDIPIVNVNGEIDIYNCSQLTEKLLKIIKSGHKNIILNLENVQYIDSTGLGSIALSVQELAKKEGKMNIICTKPTINRIFEISGLTKKNITIFEDETRALAHI